MTVISTVLSKDKIAIASDGYITNQGRVIKTNAVKFVKFDQVNCVVSFWGLATFDATQWDMYSWLQEQSENLKNNPTSCTSLEQLAFLLQSRLESMLNYGKLKHVTNKGLGLHIAGFEKIRDNLYSPELFLVTNYSLDSRGSYHVRQNSLDCTRRTIVDFIPKKMRGKSVSARKKYVYDSILSRGSVMIFNNGDPVMYNTFSQGYVSAVMRASKNESLRDLSEDERLRNLAAWPIKRVVEFQSDFYRPDKIVVGGDVSIEILAFNASKPDAEPTSQSPSASQANTSESC